MGKTLGGPRGLLWKAAEQVTGLWRWASLHCGPLWLLLKRGQQDAGEMRKRPPCLPSPGTFAPQPCLQLCASSVLSLTQSLGKFFIHALITSCLDHILSSGNWGQSSCLRLFPPCPWRFPTCCPSSSFWAWDIFFYFFGLLADQLPCGSRGDCQISLDWVGVS